MPAVGAPLQVTSREVVAPGPGEALVHIDACGVCGSDVFLHEGGFGAEKLPVVPGHEAAGRVVAVGDSADAGWIGTQVALYYIDAPVDSPHVRAGHENVGPGIRRMGVDVDGAFAEYVVRPLRTLVPIVPEIDPLDLAVATDALATPFHALTSVGRVLPGEALAVIGLGGIGSNAVQIGHQIGARVIAVGRGDAKLALAARLGADVTVRSTDGSDAVVAAAGGQIDVVLQCVGDPAMDRFAIEIAGYRARVVIVGASIARFEVAATELIWRELALLGSRAFTRRDIADVVDLVRAGKLSTAHLTSHIRPMAEAQHALDDLRRGAVLRTILVTETAAHPGRFT
jgi:D-arabinose 1-dehydrogenase-like Zn-dependent alcohol dehydrogenase